MNAAIQERDISMASDVMNMTAARNETMMVNRIEALKGLTMALLKQVEALGENRSPDLGRPNIKLADEVRRFETDIIKFALMRTGGHQRRAARMLGVKITTLNAKIKRYGIEWKNALQPATEFHAVSGLSELV